jgi:adenylate cyclase
MANKNNLIDAEIYFKKALFAADVSKNFQDVNDALSNLGKFKFAMNDIDSAEIYFRTALANDLSTANLKRIARSYSNLTGIAEKRGDRRKAISLFDSASTYAEKAGDLPLLVKIENSLAWNYSQLGDYRSAYEHKKVHAILKDSLLNIEKVRSLADMQEKYESEKKAREILGLKADKLSDALDKSHLQRTRNISIFIGLAVLGSALALWSRLRFTQRSRAAIQQEKDVSEGLLLNILPAEVAAELKAKGYTDAREFGQATILFTDFKGFTSLSEKLTPAELVAEIDHCFKAFDGLVQARRIEKIKTIGDAYMAAGGLPDPANGSPLDVVLVGLEMQRFMAAYVAERQREGRLYFEMRVGIHTGPVIAGIVGVKKFAYDIWGDTVNTASRMESSGEVGRVNISASTYELIKASPELRFIPRGLQQAKGKGEMEMYYVENA